MTAVIKEFNESQQRDRRMFGCSEAELRESIEDSITFKISGPAMVAMGYMSDAQEMLEFGGDNQRAREHIRQMLNCAKWILATYCVEK